MGFIFFDGIAPQDEIMGLLICIGIPLVGTSLMFLAVGFAYSRYYVRKKIEAASARVLQEYPEFIQANEDFRVRQESLAGAGLG